MIKAKGTRVSTLAEMDMDRMIKEDGINNSPFGPPLPTIIDRLDELAALLAKTTLELRMLRSQL